MSRIIVAATPQVGHTTPLLAVARGLVERGHDVTALVGSRFRRQAEATGARVAHLSGVADYDLTDQNASFPGRSECAPPTERC